MRLVIEGADLTGKTTLTKHLGQVLDMPVRGRITRVGDKVVQAQAEDYERHDNHILDRCYWMSDYIYEPMMAGRQSIFTDKEHLQKIVEDDTTLHIVLVADLNTLVERFNDRGDDIQTIDVITEANHRYMQLCESFKPWRNNICMISVNHKTVEDLTIEILAQWRRYQDDRN